MPNDGYFYINGTEMEEFLGKVDKTGVLNPRHRNTCYDGWKKLNKQVWEQLTPFKEFMLGWFGADTDKSRIEHTVLYHSDANRMDLCMRHVDEHIGIEFSFEHSYPLGLDDDLLGYMVNCFCKHQNSHWMMRLALSLSLC